MCSQLGYSGGDALRGSWFTALGYPAAGPSVPSWVNNVQCIGSEESLTACKSNFGAPWISPACPHTRDAGVICSNPAVASPPPAANASNGSVPLFLGYNCSVQGAVRLRGGASQAAGRVEVCMNGQWGSVCDDAWDNVDAQVVCRQLGYATGSTASSSAGPLRMQIHASGVGCNGSESTLLGCRLSSAPPACTHREDVGVACWTAGALLQPAPVVPGSTVADMAFGVQPCEYAWTMSSASSK